MSYSGRLEVVGDTKSIGGDMEIPKAPTDEERRARYGDGLRRHRLVQGLTQRAVAVEIGVDHKIVTRAEKGEASEETFEKLEACYGVRNDYPAAPRDPVRRREWFDARNASIAEGVAVPASGTFGKGVPPKEAA